MKFLRLFYFLCVLHFAFHAFARETNILPQDARRTLKNIYIKYQNQNPGKTADYIPELARVNPKLISEKVGDEIPD